MNMSHANSESSENKKVRTLHAQKDTRKKRTGGDGKEQKKGLAGN